MRHCIALARWLSFILITAAYATELTRLPLDVSTFATLREAGYTYVDKTAFAYTLITQGHRYFLSRPRRFGKSLFIATLKEILQGNRTLCDGLWIDHSDYTWPVHGVIVLDLSALGIDSSPSFKEGICHALTRVAKAYDLPLPHVSNPELALYDIVHALHQKFGRVALLIDEYDAPLLPLLEFPLQARAVRDSLHRFFAAVKGLDQYLDFVFIAGVSSLARAGLFSGINNLRVITLDEEYAALCGYTDEEIALYFQQHLEEWCQDDNIHVPDLRYDLASWYGGYRFSSAETTVHNPFSIMHALQHRRLGHYWFLSGTPTFLIDELRHHYRQDDLRMFNTVVDPQSFHCSAELLGMFDIGATPLPALMFQTGYLSIANYSSEYGTYTLRYPNEEIRTAFSKYLLALFTQQDTLSAEHIARLLRTAFIQGDITAAVHTVRQLFAHIPYQLHMPEEKFYHAILQSACTVAGIKAQSEYSTSHGRADLILEFPERIYVIEIKANCPAHVALAQIEDRRYYELFLHEGKPITLLGLSFNRSPSKFDILYASKILNN